MITPGTYKAAVLNHAITETREGKPQATVTFSFESNGEAHTITYFGSFSERAAPHTIKALLNCGLQGNNPAGPLQIGKEVQIVVEEEIGQDGKTRAKVRWVNQLGSVKNMIAPELAKTRLSQLEGAVMSARQELNIKEERDDIPF